jgi:hypothetical protein
MILYTFLAEYKIVYFPGPPGITGITVLAGRQLNTVINTGSIFCFRVITGQNLKNNRKASGVKVNAESPGHFLRDLQRIWSCMSKIISKLSNEK